MSPDLYPVWVPVHALHRGRDIRYKSLCWMRVQSRFTTASAVASNTHPVVQALGMFQLSSQRHVALHTLTRICFRTPIPQTTEVFGRSAINCKTKAEPMLPPAPVTMTDLPSTSGHVLVGQIEAPAQQLLHLSLV
jgi:hypothetical protein